MMLHIRVELEEFIAVSTLRQQPFSVIGASSTAVALQMGGGSLAEDTVLGADYRHPRRRSLVVAIPIFPPVDCSRPSNKMPPSLMMIVASTQRTASPLQMFIVGDPKRSVNTANCVQALFSVLESREVVPESVAVDFATLPKDVVNREALISRTRPAPLTSQVGIRRLRKYTMDSTDNQDRRVVVLIDDLTIVIAAPMD